MGQCISTISGGKESVGGIGNNDADVLEAVQALHGIRGFSSQLELSLSASKLRDKDILSKSDPMAVIYLKRRDGSLEELGRTEVCLNSLNPNWVTKLQILYYFDELQILLFRVYDVDTNFKGVPTKDISLSHQQFLGEMECLLAEIVTAPEQCISRTLQPNKEKLSQTSGMPDSGLLTVKSEEMVSSKCTVEIFIEGSQLDNKDTFSKSDPFLQISKVRENGSYIPVYKTEVKKNSLNPSWKPIKTNLQQLCNGDMVLVILHLTCCSPVLVQNLYSWLLQDCPLKIECFNFNTNGKHDLIGVFKTSLKQLQSIANSSPSTVNLERHSSGSQQIKKIGGLLHVRKCEVSQTRSFLDYISEGYELSFLVAIDFTASNGNPYQRDSLHYIDPSGRPNTYQRAISDVGQVLEHYDSDKQFYVWGFGGKPNKNVPVSHCFNLSKYSEQVNGISGILKAYEEEITHIHLAGPTIFGPVINEATEKARKAASNNLRKYYVLMIITDGVITDLQESINALVLASSYPLSVLIVGVGGADFTEMEYLDADRGKLRSSDGNKVAVRDIVQFVPMRNVTGSVSLAKMLLAELPSQFLKYLELKSG